MGKLWSIITIGLIVLSIALPVASGFAHIPYNLSPSEIGRFAGEMIKYWLKALRAGLI